jgi:hypothetical protein
MEAAEKRISPLVHRNVRRMFQNNQSCQEGRVV